MNQKVSLYRTHKDQRIHKEYKTVFSRVPTTKIVLLSILSALLFSNCVASPSPSNQPTIKTTPTPTSISTPSPGPLQIDGEIRRPAVAGSWYPDDPEELTSMVDGFLDAVEPIDGDPIALIVPHAGYPFSGLVAAYGFKQIDGKSYDTAIIIASDHQSPISNPISVWAEGGFETPLGIVPVDTELAEALIASDPAITFDKQAHINEHPIEIELPFLQQVCPGCSIVPILMGASDEDTIRILAESILSVLPGKRAVLIASSDLSHYPTFEDALRIDSATLASIETGDPVEVQKTIQVLSRMDLPNLVTCACGEGPILVIMRVAQGMGADITTILTYANSGHSPLGDEEQVVGYGAVMFWHYAAPTLTTQQRERLLELARDAISNAIQNRQPFYAENEDPALNRLSGAFVTLKINNELRGCVGHMRGNTPLYQIVQEMAVAAATADPRFQPLTPEELDQISIEISILSPLRRVNDIRQIEVGTHGVVIYHAGQQGVLLPQVAVEGGWDRETFLESLCEKAGLTPDCWQKNPTIYTFTAVVFGENEGG
jgi:AmmeMemoRadiSam system protein B/AmmeMemoRadiSam system protein A